MSIDSRLRSVDPVSPDQAVMAEAARVIQAGGVVAFPTTSLYGLAVDAENPAAIDKLRAIKKRPATKPILLLIKNQKAAVILWRSFPGETATLAKRLMDTFWPGDLTLVMDAGTNCPAHLPSPTGKIGLRVPSHPVAASLVNHLPGPITGTSANISGQPAVYQANQLLNTFDLPPDLILDAGILKGGPGSTVLDITTSTPEILREGILSAEKVFAAINHF